MNLAFGWLRRRHCGLLCWRRAALRSHAVAAAPRATGVRVGQITSGGCRPPEAPQRANVAYAPTAAPASSSSGPSHQRQWSSGSIQPGAFTSTQARTLGRCVDGGSIPTDLASWATDSVSEPCRQDGTVMARFNVGAAPVPWRCSLRNPLREDARWAVGAASLSPRLLRP